MKPKKVIMPVLLVFAACIAVYAADADDPIAHWKFDEGDGNTAYDSVGTNHGIIYGSEWTTGQLGWALTFDGISDHVSVPNSVSLNITGDITISAWVFLEREGGGNDQDAQAIVTKCVGRGAYKNPFDFRTHGFDSHLAFVRAGVSGHERVYSTQGLPIVEWHHVLVRVENKVPDFYFDGLITGKFADTIFTKTPTGNAKPLLIGRRDDGLHLDGTIDDVRIYGRALSAQEIQQIYEGDLPIVVDVDIKPGSCPNPLNLASRGLLPVAVLGLENFDVNSIDPASIRLEGVAPLRSHMEDVATPAADGNVCDCNAAGPDGYTDLTLKFKTQQVVAQIMGCLDEPAAGDELVLILTGALSDGTLIEAEECVVLVGNVPRALAAMKSDITEDGIVDIRDFAVLCDYWLESAAVDY